MTVQKKPRRLLTYLMTLLVLGISGALLVFFFSSTNRTFAFFIPEATATTTFGIIPLSEGGGTSTATPFQPLPTNTPTPTPTSTNTPTPTATSTRRPKPTNPPAPSDGLPSRASVSGVHSHLQSHMLSCESRSAVDFAAFFGVSISENDFLAALPRSDNPDKGFVGSPDGAGGQLPPNSYGVNAKPVADLLNEYGVPAIGVKQVSLRSIKEEIANGRPVIAWVVGNVWYGSPIIYTASDGSEVKVAYYEHTVLVTGYDENGFTFMDGNMVYWRSTDNFLSSWAALDNMIVFHQ